MLFANVSSLSLPLLGPQTHRRFKLAVVNDCGDVAPRFAALQSASILIRQRLSSRGLGPHPPVGISRPDEGRPLCPISPKIGALKFDYSAFYELSAFITLGIFSPSYL